jgi:hypothetical protein
MQLKYYCGNIIKIDTIVDRVRMLIDFAIVLAIIGMIAANINWSLRGAH